MSGQKRTILVVEDHVDSREALCEVLRGDGYAVTPVADGAAALAYLRAQPRPALVLLDLKMPGMDGWQVIETLSRDPELADVRVVVLSGASKGALPPSGAVAVVRKPIDVDDLLTAVARWSHA
jgi:CheY-like chemotaxis protein